MPDATETTHPETVPTPKRSTTVKNGNDSFALALRALGWILSDAQRSSRFLALTGLEPDDLRTRIADPALHQAVMTFLTSHEADLIACGHDLEMPPEAIQAAARELHA